MMGTSKQPAVRARKRRSAKQQVQCAPSALRIVEREMQAPTTARLTVYLGAAMVKIEISAGDAQ
jgi:hypothetical protein